MFHDSSETIFQVWKPTAAAGLARLLTVGVKNSRTRIMEAHDQSSSPRSCLS
jgi:hypothetical protein